MKTELIIHAGALMQEQFHDGMIRIRMIMQG
jgi:hypothetical protein